MAVYKVPQDVEADDKLIGPFSFRQFIYLIIVVGAGFIGWFLSQIFLPLFVIVLPVVLLFGALALPLRKDQPMETYLAAIVSFYLKPRRRLWTPDGTQSFVEITVPHVVEVQRVKDISQSEAEQRLSYLANIVDTRGWAVRGVQGQVPTSPGAMTNDAYLEAQSAADILDSTSGVGQAFDTRLDQADARRHQEMLDRMHNQSLATPEPAQAPVQYAPPTPQPQPSFAMPVADPYAQLAPPVSLNLSSNTPSAPEPAADDSNINVSFNPYPNMHQSVISPLSEAPAAPAPPVTPAQTQPAPEKPSEKPLSPDIINLANNPDLSVETIAREANRIQEKEKLSEDEVVISLR
jgi:hypothetical protein